MLRIVLFLVLIALAAAGATWIADQPGDVVLTWGGWRAAPSLPVFVLLLGLVIVAAVIGWSMLRGLWHAAPPAPPPSRQAPGARSPCHHPRPAGDRPGRQRRRAPPRR